MPECMIQTAMFYLTSEANPFEELQQVSEAECYFRRSKICGNIRAELVIWSKCGVLEQSGQLGKDNLQIGRDI